MKLKALLLLAAGLLPATVSAETAEIRTGWAAWFNTTRFSPHWGLTSDVQLRSEDGWSEVQNLLIRPGLTYHLTPHDSFTLGYAWIGTLNEPEDRAEHRIWQQYLHTQALGSVALQHRFRLEQRFVEPVGGGERAYSQRLRYFLRAVVPLAQPLSGGAKFEHGPFAALQNEVFLNVAHRDEVNGHTFDQNRAYVALGWRLRKEVDLELGYLNQYLNGRVDDTLNHVVQLALYTRF